MANRFIRNTFLFSKNVFAGLSIHFYTKCLKYYESRVVGLLTCPVGSRSLFCRKPSAGPGYAAQHRLCTYRGLSRGCALVLCWGLGCPTWQLQLCHLKMSSQCACGKGYPPSSGETSYCFFLPRQQGWHGNCQPLLAGVLTLKPNNGSAMLASVTVFGSGRKVVTRCR